MKKRLNNGIEIPEIGFGVFRMGNDQECEETVIKAIQSGYRLIDTAAAYENEEAVGKAIQKCGVPREELFITTKLWVTDTSYEKAKKAFERSLQRLGLDYIDLYIIHQPYNDYYGAWRALEELYEEGKVRAIGVDNFSEEKLADFLFFNKIKPAVNLIECNPFYQRESDLNYLTQENIQMQAWSPLAAGHINIFDNEILNKIADKHHKSVAQVILRWLIQRNIIPLVKTTNEKRMKENLDIYDFALDQDDMLAIASLDTGHSCFPERNNAASVQKFLETALKYNV